VRRYNAEVVRTGRFVPVTRDELKVMIRRSVEEAGAHDLTPLFLRAGLVSLLQAQE
jgi:hypothetical protein